MKIIVLGVAAAIVIAAIVGVVMKQERQSAGARYKTENVRR